MKTDKKSVKNKYVIAVLLVLVLVLGVGVAMYQSLETERVITVSYTHLTLPTIYSV